MTTSTEAELRAEIEGWRAALLRRNAELDEARAELERYKAARLRPELLSMGCSSPEELVKLIGLCMVGERAGFHMLSDARAFAARMDELSCERLVQACLERGRPKGLLARMQAAAHRALGDRTMVDSDGFEAARRAVLAAVAQEADVEAMGRVVVTAPPVTELRELLALVLEGMAASHPLHSRIAAALEVGARET